MFGKKETLIILVAFIILTPAIAFLALNWDREAEEAREVKQILEVPEIDTPGFIRTPPRPPAAPAPAQPREIEIQEEEKEEEDTSRTIDLF